MNRAEKGFAVKTMRCPNLYKMIPACITQACSNTEPRKRYARNKVASATRVSFSCLHVLLLSDKSSHPVFPFFILAKITNHRLCFTFSPLPFPFQSISRMH